MWYHRFVEMALFAIVLLQPAKTIHPENTEDVTDNQRNNSAFSDEAAAAIFGICVLLVCGAFYLCISWTCCFEHGMFYSNENENWSLDGQRNGSAQNTPINAETVQL